jgi:hypothetical protein
LNASSGGRGAGGGSGSNTSARVQLFGQSIGAQLFSQSITIGVQLFSQSSTRNLHRACINLDTGSRAQSGSDNPRKASCHQMDHATQGVEVFFLYVDFLPSAEAPGA